MDDEGKPRITIFPEHADSFAWLMPPCEEDELDICLGADFGDACRGVLYTEEGEKDLPQWLKERLSIWMDKWIDLDIRIMGMENFQDVPSEEVLAIDAEGVALTKELKKLFGDKYRFRYEYAWVWYPWNRRLYGNAGWIVV